MKTFDFSAQCFNEMPVATFRRICDFFAHNRFEEFGFEASQYVTFSKYFRSLEDVDAFDSFLTQFFGPDDFSHDDYLPDCPAGGVLVYLFDRVRFRSLYTLLDEYLKKFDHGC